MIVTAGSIDRSVYYYIVQDASGASPGEPVTGLLFSDIETGGSASFVRQGAARVDLTLVTLSSASTTHTDGGFIEVDATNMPGLYRCDYPDAAWITGVDQIFCQIVVAAAKNAVAAPILIDLTDVDLRDSVRAGLTALPNAAADAAGGLVVSDSGGLDMDGVLSGNTPQTADNDTKLTTLLARIIGTLAAGTHNPATAAQIAVLSDWINGGRLDLILDIIAVNVDGLDGAAMRGTEGALTDKAGFSLSAIGLDLIASTAIGMVEIAKAIWDRVLTGATHNILNSAGRRVREVIDTVVLSSDEAQAGTINTITLATGEPSVDGTYDPAVVTIVGGTGIGQTRLILQYEGSTRIAIVDRNWKITPDATSFYTITSDPGREHVNEGLAQAATANTITLNTLASSIDDIYIGQLVFVRSGTGDDQAKLVTDYDGSTKIATIDTPWGVVPDGTSAYVMLPTSPVSLSTATQASIDSIQTQIGIAGAGLTDLGGMSTAMKAEILVEVVKLYATQMAEDYAADGTAPTLEQALMLIQQALTEFAFAGTSNTVKKLDGTATAAIMTLDDATNPTSSTRTT